MCVELDHKTLLITDEMSEQEIESEVPFLFFIYLYTHRLIIIVSLAIPRSREL